MDKISLFINAMIKNLFKKLSLTKYICDVLKISNTIVENLPAKKEILKERMDFSNTNSKFCNKNDYVDFENFYKFLEKPHMQLNPLLRIFKEVEVDIVSPNHLLTGDIIFQTTSGSDFSNAINGSTQTDNSLDFVHVGIICRDKKTNKICVFHASPSSGVVYEDLETFMGKYEEKTKIPIKGYIYRVADKFRHRIPCAIDMCEKVLGQPYNKTFIWDDFGLYCSELVLDAFDNPFRKIPYFDVESLEPVDILSDRHVFYRHPLSFREKNSKKIAQYWIDYYKNLNMTVPVECIGCNPNFMAHSKNIVPVGVLQDL
eukprot:TRINITY_DN2362_c0_g1_i1.p1 TRINITY_DN2362_c0_g1~~TRINITY_DN2362_c0_g1_i1.p1  ORF type:complete len:315 (-),score=71.93 TRINITY_DN2362_c0_g1_i1:721-1665(-)